MAFVERNGVRVELPYGGMRLKIYQWKSFQRSPDFSILTPISQRDELWQEAVLVALTKLKPARAFTQRYAKPVIAALLEITF